MAGDLKGFVQVGFDVLTTTVNATTKKITAQIGSVVGETTDADNVEWWQHYGFASRPPKPDPGKAAAQAVVLRAGDHDIAIASQDLRGLDLYGSLDHGEVCIYSAGEDGNGQARILLKKTGSVQMYTRKGNVIGGAGMLIQLDAENGAARVLNDKGYGLIADADGVTLTAGNAGLQLDASGNASLIGKGTTKLDGAGIMLGAAALPTGIATMMSLLPLFVSLQAFLTAMQAFLNFPGIVAVSGATASPLAAAAGATQAILALPTNFSLKSTSG